MSTTPAFLFFTFRLLWRSGCHGLVAAATFYLSNHLLMYSINLVNKLPITLAVTDNKNSTIVRIASSLPSVASVGSGNTIIIARQKTKNNKYFTL